MINIIKSWRKAFNLPVRTKFELPSQDEFELAVRLIREELAELEEAYHNKDKKEYLDAGADLEFVLKQLHCVSGYNIEEAVGRVAESNMSKSCRYYSDAVESVKAYAVKGVDAYIREVDGLHFIYRKSDNKLLKGIHFREPDFTGLLGENNQCTNTKCNCETCGKSAQVDLYSDNIVKELMNPNKNLFTPTDELTGKEKEFRLEIEKTVNKEIEGLVDLTEMTVPKAGMDLPPNLIGDDDSNYINVDNPSDYIWKLSDEPVEEIQLYPPTKLKHSGNVDDFLEEVDPNGKYKLNDTIQNERIINQNSYIDPYALGEVDRIINQKPEDFDQVSGKRKL